MSESKQNTTQPQQPRFSKETLLAMQEARDIMSGKIQAKSYDSMAELLKDLNDDDED